TAPAKGCALSPLWTAVQKAFSLWRTRDFPWKAHAVLCFISQDCRVSMSVRVASVSLHIHALIVPYESERGHEEAVVFKRSWQQRATRAVLSTWTCENVVG
ncbi:unnamed protein product, partial [Ectocarpus fasciculatus]